VGGVHISLDTGRLDANVTRAQQKLNMQIAADCEPLVPFRQGSGGLRGSMWYPEGISGGVIEWNAIYSHYMYAGEVYGPNIPIKDADGNVTGWWSPPHKEPTGRQIAYHTPGTMDHWFEVAKSRHLKDWEDLVKKEVGKD
jgi:hypothetical protein